MRIELIRFEGVDLDFAQTSVLKDLSLTIEPGQLVSLIGASGSGKTTSLRLINGLLRPTRGKVFFNGQPLDYTQLESLRRKMGYSVQGSGLFPHLTVLENLSLVARLESWSSTKCQQRAEELLNMVNMPPEDFLQKYPSQLSGGQKQRVGVARALFLEPEVVLMDEPFGALDPITRTEIQDEVLRLMARLGFTVVLVTHDLQEAMKMSDRMVLLHNGRVEQMGAPFEFMSQPNSQYVEEFLRVNSPGKVLKEIKLYSVVEKNVWRVQKTGEGFGCLNLLSGEKKMLNSEQEVLSSIQQNYYYFVDGDEKLIDVKQNKSNKWISLGARATSDQSHFLSGIDDLVRSGRTAIPLVNQAGGFEGVLSQRAISSLH